MGLADVIDCELFKVSGEGTEPGCIPALSFCKLHDSRMSLWLLPAERCGCRLLADGGRRLSLEMG